MKKACVALTSVVSASGLIATVNAQTTETPSSNLAVEIVAVVIVVAVGAFIVYAGYKVVKKWIGGGPN